MTRLYATRWPPDPSPRPSDHLQPSLEEGLFELGMMAPPYFDHVLEAYQDIHYHYKRGFDQHGPESYYISREIRRLSELLRKLYFATGMRELASWSNQLKYMRSDVQLGPGHRQLSTLPKHRHNSWFLH